MMEAETASEIYANLNQTTLRNITEDSHFKDKMILHAALESIGRKQKCINHKVS
jgi:hypothetical protein